MAKGKRIDIVTLERAQHEDLTRGDAFTMAATLEIMRGLYDDRRWPMSYPGLTQRTVALEAPLRAHVLSGLLIRPDNPSYLTVDEGTLLAAVPAASSDDSILELVTDPGVTSTTTLQFVANAAGSVRLDIVECSVVDTQLESATRGVFNTSTRNFDPTIVGKVHAPRLSYRIRQGVAGAGLSAVASGWLPLAVICHQPGTTGFNQCDLWDVRPLVADRMQFAEQAKDPSGASGSFRNYFSSVDGTWIGRGTFLEGHATSQYDGYLAGGRLVQSTATTIADFGVAPPTLVNVDVQNNEPGFVLPSGAIFHLAAVFPAGLPRWVKYTNTASYGVTGTRVPFGPRGLLVFTAAQPDRSGRFAAVVLPVLSGFTAAAPGVSLAAIASDGATVDGICSRNHVSVPVTAVTLNAPVLAAGVATWTINPTSLKVPGNATELDVRIVVTLTTTGDHTITIRVKNGTGVIATVFSEFLNVTGRTTYTIMRRIPLIHTQPDGQGPLDTVLEVLADVAVSAPQAAVFGYYMN